MITKVNLACACLIEKIVGMEEIIGYEMTNNWTISNSNHLHMTNKVWLNYETGL